MRDFIRRNLANFVTALRIPFSLMMVPFDIFSRGYFIFFTLAGITDVVDGAIARKLNTKSVFGSRLDSVSDFLFYLIACAKLVPFLLLHLQRRLWCYMGFVFILRLFCYIFALVRYGCYPSHHTYLNKATGVVTVFTIYTMPLIPDCIGLTAALTLTVALLAAIEEIFIIAIADKHQSDVHTVLDAIARKRAEESD